MPLKLKKNNAPKNGSPKAEKLPTILDSLAPTNYREIHQNEAEVLRSIYTDDFEDVENRRPAWQVSRQYFGMASVSLKY
jgi:eukaryotic translation initiation factor 2-alpha kinase 4